VLQQSFTHMVDSAQQRVVVLVGAASGAMPCAPPPPTSAVLAPARRDLLAFDASATTPRPAWLAGLQPHATCWSARQDERQLRSQPAAYWTENALAAVRRVRRPETGRLPRRPVRPVRRLDAGARRRDPGASTRRPSVRRRGRARIRAADLHAAPSGVFAGAQRRVVPLLDAAKAAARRAVPAAEVIQAGVVLHAAAAGSQASREVETIGLGSLVGIVLLTWLTFRSVQADLA
jgi:predicted exporter